MKNQPDLKIATLAIPHGSGPKPETRQIAANPATRPPASDFLSVKTAAIY